MRSQSVRASKCGPSERRPRINARSICLCRVFGDPSLERGFLPVEDPVRRLAGPEFAAWEAALDEIPKLAVAAGGGRLRRELEALPPFPLARLPAAAAAAEPRRLRAAAAAWQEGGGGEGGEGDGGGGGGDAQMWRAYSVLSFLSHAYLWCDGPGTPQRLPAVLARPWVAVSAALAMPPVLVYATYNLLNWRRLDAGGPIALGNVACINNFLGGVDEEWFRLVHVSIEAAAGPGLARLGPLQAAAREGDTEGMLAHLAALHRGLLEMQRLLGRMGEKCDPYVYYHRVRAPMAGWRGNPALPAGLVYGGVAAAPLALHGETGAQSSVVASLDAALGVEHECGWLRDYLTTMRRHMPPHHRAFIVRLEAANAAAAAQAGPGGATAAPRTVRGAATAGPAALREAYNEVVGELEAFRKQHRAFAAAYIANFAKREAGAAAQKGTGGSDFMPALAGFARTTAAHRLP
ncbi:MAG: hypothetical protein J3K34DRAFT_523547 [Monoraphidium minutum]|nr:MAG: hypothetical protein J3K34DRAFT_523547 [Monoraphidium minutum]